MSPGMIKAMFRPPLRRFGVREIMVGRLSLVNGLSLTFTGKIVLGENSAG